MVRLVNARSNNPRQQFANRDCHVTCMVPKVVERVIPAVSSDRLDALAKLFCHLKRDLDRVGVNLVLGGSSIEVWKHHNLFHFLQSRASLSTRTPLSFLVMAS